MAIDHHTRERVRLRARFRCEYCRLPELHSTTSHHMEHIVARQHGGNDDSENLALARFRCNRKKGPNLSAIDPETNTIVELFHPRRDIWDEHFEQIGLQIRGRTPKGRALVNLLALNDQIRLELRALA